MMCAVALVLDVERPARPALRLEVAGRGLLALRQGGVVVLLARIERQWMGVDYVSTGRYRPPIAPIRAGRAFGPHHFAAALIEAADGPLHSGRWVISPEATHLRSGPDLLAGDPELGGSEPHGSELPPGEYGWIEWFHDNGAWQILPLRRLSRPDAGRVKAYRKRAREGTLAPVLLWWISGLDCYVVLDGHDRLVAALAEGQKPPLLALSSADPGRAERDTEALVARYLTTAEALERQTGEGVRRAEEAVNRGFGRDLRTIETAYGTTRAWPLPGGTAAWNALAATEAPDWHPADQ